MSLWNFIKSIRENVAGAEDPEEVQVEDDASFEDYLWNEDLEGIKDLANSPRMEVWRSKLSPRRLEILKTVLKRKELGEAREVETEPDVEAPPTEKPSKPRNPVTPQPGVTPKPKAKRINKDVELFLKARESVDGNGEHRRMINFDRAMLKRLKDAYQASLNEPGETFNFEGNEFVKGYAKYLIEYLESQFGEV